MSSISTLMEQVFNKVLPIPRTPRVYHPPPPARPLSWIPHGKTGDPVYEERLRSFANEIKVIDSQRTKSIKYSSRGWCYLLEGLGKITKGEFNACQTAINNCRKIGLLPIDFVREDQDETRRFQGFMEVSDPATVLEKIKSDVSQMLVNLPLLTTDFWVDEQFYLMMCVEKGDILELFKPICNEYHVPIVSSKGWTPILLRSHIAKLSEKAETKQLQPILLLFYDHDPVGLKISSTFKKKLEDCERGTGWNPENLIIERFGLNKEDVDKYNLMWIENLRTGSGRESHDYLYIQRFGKRKCESNALLKNDETLKAGEEICRSAIEKYYGKDARERFKKKEEETKQKFSQIYDAPIWEEFDERVDELIESLSVKEPEKEPQPKETITQKEVEVIIDSKFYGKCPKCGKSFNYDSEDAGRLVRCRFCNQPMRLRLEREKNG